MAGYLPEEESADAFADGWYRTGDVGWLEPEGWVHLTDRSKEMIKVNGFQVAPAEVEEVLRSHPSVLDCAVFGLADERAGEVPVAVVQLDPDRPATAEEIQELVAESLATYKQVRHVVFVDVHPPAALGQGAAAHAPRRVDPGPAGPGRERLMDVRLSSEQQALRDSVAQVVDRLGPGTVRDLDDAERSAKLDAAVAASGWRELRVPVDGRAPLASGVEAAVVAEELGRGLADTPVPRAHPGRRAAQAGRCADGRRRRDGRLHRRRWPRLDVVDGGVSSGTVAVDARGATTALVLVPDGTGHALASVALGPVGVGTDLTRPGAAVEPGRPSPGRGAGLAPSDRRTTCRRGRRSVWRSTAPTSSG